MTYFKWNVNVCFDFLMQWAPYYKSGHAMSCICAAFTRVILWVQSINKTKKATTKNHTANWKWDKSNVIPISHVQFNISFFTTLCMNEVHVFHLIYKHALSVRTFHSEKKHLNPKNAAKTNFNPKMLDGSLVV